MSKVMKLKDILLRGKETRDQINILGDDGVPIDYHIIFNKSEVIDFIILQQDAFDAVDHSTPLERQHYMVNVVLEICDTKFEFDGFEEVNGYFKKIINFMKQMNYQQFNSEEFKTLEVQVRSLITEKAVREGASQ